MKLVSKEIINKKPLEIKYIIENTFPYYEEIENFLNEITPEKSIDVLQHKNEIAVHEMIKVTQDTITMMYKELR